MEKDATEKNLNSKQEEQIPGELSYPNLGDEFPPFIALDNYGQEVIKPIFQNDTAYRELLAHFQNARWEECLKIIDGLLAAHPQDAHLLAFKQDVEVRLRLQSVHNQTQSEEDKKRRRKVGIRIFVFSTLAVTTITLIVWGVIAYRNKQIQIQQEQQAALVAQALAEKIQTADSFMRVDKPEEALRLYDEIRQVDPSYLAIDQKIDLAKRSMAVEGIYQQGMLAMQAGDTGAALEFFLKVDEQHPKYKDTPQLLLKIQQEQKIAVLVEELQNAYSQEDWVGVINAHEAIRAIDPFYDITDLKHILFISYRNVIVEIAGRGDVTIDRIELAEKYYRIALSLFPQSKEYAAERQELQSIAVELLANRYYLHAITLLRDSNYSAKGLQELIRILEKANNIGTSSPAIKVEIENSQLYLNSYDYFLQRNWDGAISGFVILLRKDENFANGRMKYLLFESYIARGDLLFDYADFSNASLDYQEAEKFVWSGKENILRLFQIQVRTAAALHKLGKVQESAEFYHYAFDRLGYQKLVTASKGQDLLNTLTQAELAYTNGDRWEAIRLYEIAVGQVNALYEYRTVTVNQGDALTDIAFQYDSTLESLRDANNIGESMFIARDQDIRIPFIPGATP